MPEVTDLNAEEILFVRRLMKAKTRILLGVYGVIGVAFGGILIAAFGV